MFDIKIVSEIQDSLSLLINGKKYQYASDSFINSKFKWLLSKNKGSALAYLRKNATLSNCEDYDPNFHIEFPKKK